MRRELAGGEGLLVRPPAKPILRQPLEVPPGGRGFVLEFINERVGCGHERLLLSMVRASGQTGRHLTPTRPMLEDHHVWLTTIPMS